MKRKCVSSLPFWEKSGLEKLSEERKLSVTILRRENTNEMKWRRESYVIPSRKSISNHHYSSVYILTKAEENISESVRKKMKKKIMLEETTCRSWNESGVKKTVGTAETKARKPLKKNGEEMLSMKAKRKPKKEAMKWRRRRQWYQYLKKKRKWRKCNVVIRRNVKESNLKRGGNNLCEKGVKWQRKLAAAGKRRKKADLGEPGRRPAAKLPSALICWAY